MEFSAVAAAKKPAAKESVLFAIVFVPSAIALIPLANALKPAAIA
ncbi:hypothetical protein [Synechococcus sp. UW140]